MFTMPNTLCNVHNAQSNLLKFNEMGREDKPSEKASFDGERKKFLGCKWDLEKDELSPGLGELNLNKKRRREKKPNLEPVRTLEDAEKLLSSVLLTRNLTSSSKIRLMCLDGAAEFAGGVVVAGKEISPGVWTCSLFASKSRMMKEIIPRNLYDNLRVEKPVEESIQVECFPESFMKKFSCTEEDLEETDGVDDGYEEFSVLAASAGKGIAELLVDPVFQGWRRAPRITGYMQGWRTKY